MPGTVTRSTKLVRPQQHLFLSPHYDDIALSAGGTVRILANSGRAPRTAIVFGSEPDASRPLSPFAQAMHEGWGFTAGEAIASRQAEERAAAAHLGATPRILPFQDAIYRGDLYLSDDDLFGDPHGDERSLPAQVAGALGLPPEPTGEIRLYAPLAIGHHVDHLLVFATGTLLAGRGWDVWFYEDIPYALKPGAVDARLAEIAASIALEPVAEIPVEAAWDAKIDAILSYPSQLETIFRSYVGIGTSREEISEALRRYAGRHGEVELSERFWKVK